ncbi:unnamed protein product [Prunus armeniaca]
MGRERREDGKPKKRRAHSWQEKRGVVLALCRRRLGFKPTYGLGFQSPNYLGLGFNAHIQSETYLSPPNNS